MLTVAGVSGACTVLFALAIPSRRSRADDQTRVGVRHYVAVLVLTGLLGAVAGSLEVVAPALAIAAHHPGAAGPLVIVATLGTVVSGVLAMRYSDRFPARSVLLTASALQVLGTLVLLVPGPLAVAAVGLFVVGAGGTPAIAALGVLVRDRAAGTAEAFGWQSTALGLGVAGGSAAAGALVAAGAHLSALPALACAAACAVIAALSRVAISSRVPVSAVGYQ
jgi:MFS family permease